MKFDYPAPEQIPALRSLWKTAFGDGDAFLDLFFSSAYTPRRCRCAVEDDRVAAALYWFDVSWNDCRCAYIYAVATDPRYRGRGICRKLMADTAALLKGNGYQGILLVPQEEGLFSMYAKMGYLPGSSLDEFHCAASEHTVPIREITAAEYAAHRRISLPPGGVIQEGENLTFLAGIARFYRGDGFLAAVSREEAHLRILEYLGDPDQIAPLVAALGRREATVRTPGNSKAFSMYLPLTPDCPKPEYFAFCFD